MKRTKGLYLILYIGVLMACVAACTEIEMVDVTTNRPKYSLLSLDFNWQGAEADKPQYVQFLAVRSVRSWRAHGIADTDAPQSPWFGLSEPLLEGSAGENGTGEGEGAQPGMGRSRADEADDEPADETPEDDGQTDVEEETPVIDPNARYRFRLKGGQYFLLATNHGLEENTIELRSVPDDSQPVTEGVVEPEDPENLKHYLTDMKRRTNDLQLRIRALDGRPTIVEDKDLPDFNPKFKYLAECQRIFFGLHPEVKVVAGTDAHARIDMNTISQEVQVRFTVVMDGRVKLEGMPVVELSGLCGHINLIQGFIDTTQVYRSAVEAKPDGPQQEKTYTYIARFHTLGVVPAVDKEHLVGPGVVQVAVKVVPDGTDPEQKEKGRYVYAGINPYTEITEAQIIVMGEDGKPRLREDNLEPILIDVTQPLVINEKYLINASQGLGWKQQKPTDIDVDI